MYNPRFPHTLQVQRPKKVNGEIVYDANGNVTYEAVTLAKVNCVGYNPVRDANGNFVTTDVVSIEYGDRTGSENTQSAGDVVKSDFRLATPLFTTELKYGDRLVMTNYDRTFTCTVVKKTSWNWGANIWCNEVRN